MGDLMRIFVGGLWVGMLVGFGVGSITSYYPYQGPLTPARSSSPHELVVQLAQELGLPEQFALAQMTRESGLRPGQWTLNANHAASIGMAQLNLRYFPDAVDMGWSQQLRVGLRYLHGWWEICRGDTVCAEHGYRTGHR